MDRLIMAILALIPLAGVLAGMGGWCAIFVTAALGQDPIMDSLGDQLFGAVAAIFFGGICLAAITLYISFLIDAPWRKEPKP